MGVRDAVRGGVYILFCFRKSGRRGRCKYCGELCGVRESGFCRIGNSFLPFLCMYRSDFQSLAPLYVDTYL